ncbi:G-protein coupled receptor Mth2-like isoform X3 [Diorhabda sublineata]|uniref:G-protein coupled receptor Mth2-like isoform X3 n=1 Tax=Diorhabda sublineata TaxID=1163346 RepID=UPI0024E0F504|nr:G-protein coupled receptor Mth2-like isoform X3 [Diorhabda sublineata]
MFVVVFLLIGLLQTYGVCDESVCENSVDITDGIRSGTNITKDDITYTEKNYFVQGDSIKGCICNVKQCIRKCCDEGEVMNMTTRTCVADKSSDTPYSAFSVYSIIVVPDNQICDKIKTRVLINDDFRIIDGELIWDDVHFEMDDYCLIKNGDNYIAIACVQNQTSFDGFVATSGMIISMPFLLATFLVYLILPERNLHRKALMSYVFTLLAAYITLVTIQMYPYQFKPVPCQILGYCIIFFFLVSFFWMNVMCIDMWLAFSGMRTVMSKKYAERKRFIIYCIYAWGTPIIHVGIVLLLNTHSPPDADYYPKIGDPRCFLGDGMPTFYYFYLPMAIIIGINIVFFILTTVRIQQIKKETSMLKQTESKKSYEDDKQKFNLYLKLMFAMGINWIMELISWTVEKLLRDTPTFIWYLSDFTNAMYGVLIFVIFVFKKKIWQSLKKRYYVFIGKPHLAHSFTTSSARGTRASNYSTTDTAVSTDYRLNDMKRIPEESALNRT